MPTHTSPQCETAGVNPPLGFTVILWAVVGETVQDEDLAPLSALVQSCQKLVDVLGVEIQQVAVWVRLADLRQGSYGIGHDLTRGEESS